MALTAYQQAIEASIKIYNYLVLVTETVPIYNGIES